MMQVLSFYLFGVNKSVSKSPERDLHSAELRGEETKHSEEKQSRRGKAFTFFQHEKPLCCGCQLSFRWYWRPRVWCSQKDDFDDCLIAIWSCWETVWTDNLWVENIISNYNTQSAPHAFQAQMSYNEEEKLLGFNPMSNQVWPLFIRALFCVQKMWGQEIPEL